MQVFKCDVCKSEIREMNPGRTIFHIREFELCEHCHDDLNAAVKQTLRQKKPFDFAWYERLSVDLIQDGMKKNRIAVPAR
ncbi:MAG: hypothetical protein ABIJ86_17415 [Spirochaetota bacterium]